MTPRQPGQWMLDVLSRVCVPETYDRIVVPIVADLRVEMAARRRRGVGTHSWVRLRGYAALVCALIVDSVGRSGRIDVREDRSHIVSATVTSAVVITSVGLARTLTRAQHVRVALAAACVVLAMVGLAVAKLARRRRAVRGALAAIVTLGYYALFVVGVGWARGADLPPAVTAWVANVAFLVLAVTGLSLPLRDRNSDAAPATRTD